jgi:uncharacterized protein (TIGR02147 family)
MNPTDLQQILSATNYREFIKRMLESRAPAGRKPNYSALARRAGFSSRSFPRDVVMGKKRIVLSSLGAFSKGLGLKGDTKTYFHLLVALDEPEVNEQGWDREVIHSRLDRLRSKLLARRADASRKQPNPFYEKPEWMDIYASLGTVENGASIDEVAKRSGLTTSACAAALSELEKREVVAFDPDRQRYLPRSLNLVFEQMGKDQFFKNFYMQTLAEARSQAEKNFAAVDRLFFNSVLSIKEERLAEFQKDLRDVLFKYVEEFEAPDGDHVAKLSVALWPTGGMNK